MTTPWDQGVRYFSTRTVAPTALPVSVDYIRDSVLRAINGTAEDAWIERAVQTAVESCEAYEEAGLMPQTWTLTLDRFPCRIIELPRFPASDVVSIEYYDTDNVLQTLDSSPAVYTVIPSGETRRAQVIPTVNTYWPQTACRPDAVTITYSVGYPLDSSSPPQGTVPERIITGIALMVGELYKQRSLSVQEPNNTPATLQLEHFWRRRY